MARHIKVGLMGLSTDETTNWGSQATSDGIRYMLKKQYPNAEFIQISLPKLPFKKIKFLRQYNENALIRAILSDDVKKVDYYLNKLNMHENIFKGCTHIVLNGEGMIHHDSGHISILMGLLYRESKAERIISVINQTVDLEHNTKLEKLVKKVYNIFDFISVREPLSYDYLQKIGVEKVELIPDAVYGLPKIKEKEITQRVEKYNLPEKYITVTASSFLKRNRKSLKEMKKIIEYLRSYFNITVVFMASAKTDIWLAHQLKKVYDLTIIEPPVKYEDAISIIARSKLLVGGRQHPNIFAYIYKVPYIPFRGNTFKNEGVAKLQHYPLSSLQWNIEEKDMVSAIEILKEQKILFSEITIDTFNILTSKEENFEKTPKNNKS